MDRHEEAAIAAARAAEAAERAANRASGCSGPDEREVALAYLSTIGERYEAYHAHKENLVYAAAALYVTGALAVLLGVPPGSTLVVTLVFMCIAVIAFEYVRWQLEMKNVAADRSDACSSLAARWVATPPKPGELAVVQGYPERIGLSPEDHVDIPLALALEEQRYRALRKGRDFPRSEPLTYLLMLVCTAGVVFGRFGEQKRDIVPSIWLIGITLVLCWVEVWRNDFRRIIEACALVLGRLIGRFRTCNVRMPDGSLCWRRASRLDAFRGVLVCCEHLTGGVNQES